MEEKWKNRPHLSWKLYTLRTNNGMSQEELADHLGLKRCTYARYETGANHPPQKVLDRLATEFQVPRDYWMDETPAAASLPLRQEPDYAAERMRECDKRERAFLSLLRRMGDEEKENLYFYCLDLLDEGGTALADILLGDKT